MKCKYILFFIILLTACQENRQVDISFYYWKTVYKANKQETSYLNSFKSKKLYVRIMDVDNQNQNPVPIAPISFVDQIPKPFEIVPVVFIVNNVLKGKSQAQLKRLAQNISGFVKDRVGQSGKGTFKELQIDCDWTETTKENYFYFLGEIVALEKGRLISVTLRLHQLKNQVKSGIPPVDKVLLMCYNMGNLREYGNQNSILDVAELKKYAGQNLNDYPMDIDVGLPLFSWSVVFDNRAYAGISKRVKVADLKNPLLFDALNNGLYRAKTELPAFGIRRNWEVRFEESRIESLKEIAAYLSSHLSKKPINLVYYHLDEELLKNYPIHELEKVNHIFY